MLDFVAPGTALPEDFHFNRLVDQQTAEHIKTIIAARFGIAAAAEPAFPA